MLILKQVNFYRQIEIFTKGFVSLNVMKLNS